VFASGAAETCWGTLVLVPLMFTVTDLYNYTYVPGMQITLTGHCTHCGTCSVCCKFNFPQTVITLRAKLSGSVYCNRSCLWVCLCVCGWVCLWVCYHDNSKLRASIFTRLGL